MQATNSFFTSATTLEDVAATTLKQLGAWRAAITLPTTTHEITLAAAGHSLPEQFSPHLPISMSICAHVAHMNHALLIDDAFTHPLLSNHPAVSELGVAAYIGVPVMPMLNGRYTMVLCAIQIKPRSWSAEDLDLLTDGAARIRALSPTAPNV